MKNFIIAPSILSADFAKLGEDVAAALKAGADIIHFDVMDNHFVPNLTVGPLVCAALRNYGITAPIDVHLMTKPVDKLITSFAQAGATYITFHPEASENVAQSLQLIIDSGCMAGLAFNPETTIDYATLPWEKLSLLVLMTVNPGFGGQKFITEALPKIKKTRDFITQHSTTLTSNPLLEVDGGINLNNIKMIAEAGADIFVMGSAIFSAEKPYSETIKNIKNILSPPQGA